MIPIECPNCGRGGNVPPDRLNARLVCKACHSVFHMDSGGRMVLGEPGGDPKKAPKARAAASPAADFDLAQTIKDIPLPVKIGVPAAIAVVLGLLFNPFGGGAPNYESSARTILNALIANDKPRVVSMASASTAAEAGKWFDLARPQIEQNKIGPNNTASVALFSGLPDKESQLTLWCVVSDNAQGASSTVPLHLLVVREGNDWKLDGAKTLEDAERTAAANKQAKK